MSMMPTLHTEEAAREAARRARLRYVKDTEPGITRQKKGEVFHYFAPTSERITEDDTIDRINKLAIPPAYTDVWICTLENGHLQATGRDARKRKQYRYHPKWSVVRNETKFTQIGEFAAALAKIRAQLAKDLKLPGLPREKVLAAIVTLMDECQMRVGNDQYAKENNSFGLTTIRKKHVEVDGNNIRFEFKGKSGKLWQRDVNSKQIARIVSHCEEIPGQELFKYICDDGSRKDVKSEDVNAYLQEISGKPFTAKDFRTWAATALAINLLAALEPQESERGNAQQLNAAIKQIAAEMGHTPAICRKCYIYPGVLDAYAKDTLRDWYKGQKNKEDQSLVTRFIGDF